MLFLLFNVKSACYREIIFSVERMLIRSRFNKEVRTAVVRSYLKYEPQTGDTSPAATDLKTIPRGFMEREPPLNFHYSNSSASITVTEIYSRAKKARINLKEVLSRRRAGKYKKKGKRSFPDDPPFPRDPQSLWKVSRTKKQKKKSKFPCSLRRSR